MVSKDYSLKQLSNCSFCPDLLTNRTQVVIGDGSLTPDVVFIGEAPGKKEDEQGNPFIGKSGQILRNNLKDIGFDNFYITNIVKCRPPNNRDPSTIEAKNCFPYLGLQLKNMNPKIICTLGAHSTKYILSGGDFNKVSSKPMSEFRGEFFNTEIEGTKYIIFSTYHPAATIYNQKLKQTFVNDLKRLKGYLSNITSI